MGRGGKLVGSIELIGIVMIAEYLTGSNNPEVGMLVVEGEGENLIGLEDAVRRSDLRNLPATIAREEIETISFGTYPHTTLVVDGETVGNDILDDGAYDTRIAEDGCRVIDNIEA
jgi:hypothetical protein